MLEARPPSVAAPAPGDQPAELQRPDELATEVAKAVRELRASAGLSERAAARLLGTSQTQLRRMEDPRYLPSLRSLARVAAAYGRRLQVAFEARVSPAASRAAPGLAKDRQPARAPAGAPRPARTPQRSKGASARAKRPATARTSRAARPRRRA